MKLKSISIQNFLSIKKIDLNLDGQGLVLLNGKNLDADGLNANGAGKSSIVEAIVYALYGRTLRGLKGDAVVHRIPKKNLKVFLDLEDDNGNNYRIARYRKHTVNKNKSFIYMNSKDITPKSEADVNNFVAGLIQADFVTFTSSILYSSASFKFCSATDAEMKKAFTQMLGLDVYSNCLDIASNKLRGIAAALDVINTNLYNYGSRIVDLDKQIKELTQDKEEWGGQQKAKIRELKDTEESYKYELAEYKKQLETCEKQKVEYESKQVEAESQLVELQEKLKNVEELRQTIQETEDDIAHLERTIKKHKYNIKEQEDIADSNMTKVNKRQKKAQELKEKKETLDKGIGMPCPTCGQPMTAESLEPAKAEIDEQILEYKTQIATFHQRVKDAQKSIKNSEEIISECEDEKSGLKGSIERLQKEINESKSLIDKKSDTEQEVLKYSKNNTEAIEKIKSINKRITYTKSIIVSTQKDIKEAGEETCPYDKMIAKCESDKQNYQNKINELTASVKDKVEEREMLEFWQKAFSNQGIKSFILDDITPFLNKRVNKYLSILTGGHIEATFSTQTTLKTGEKRERFSLDINNADGGSEYQANSGGEKKRVDLAVNLALHDLISSRSSNRMNIIVWDEVFDAIDSEGVEKVIELLQELAKEKSSIFVISHNSELKSQFENVITVVKKDGFSTLEGNNRNNILNSNK